MTFARFTTDANTGKVRGYLGEAGLPTTAEYVRRYGVAEFPRLQPLLRYFCENGSSTTSRPTSGPSGRRCLRGYVELSRLGHVPARSVAKRGQAGNRTLCLLFRVLIFTLPRPLFCPPRYSEVKNPSLTICFKPKCHPRRI